MTDRPTKAELLEAVREFLAEQLGPKLAGADAFYARVAANMLAIVERELELGPEAQAAEQARLEALLGETGELDALNKLLCKAIRSGALDIDDPALRAHLRETTLAKLAVDQPGYETYRRMKEPGD